MSFIKKYLLIVTTVICIIGIVTSFAALYPRRYDDGLAVTDISATLRYSIISP